MHRATLLAIGLVLGILIIGLVVISTYGEDIRNALLSPPDQQNAATAGNNNNGNTGSPSDTNGAVGGSNSGASGGGASSSTNTPIPDDRVECTPESHTVEACEPIDHPVCGWYDPAQVACETGSCVRSSFPNECDACRTPHIIYWTTGDCPLHG